MTKTTRRLISAALLLAAVATGLGVGTGINTLADSVARSRPAGPLGGSGGDSSPEQVALAREPR